MSILIKAEKLKQYKQEILQEKQKENQPNEQRLPSPLDPSQYSFFSDFYPQMPFCLGEAADSYLFGLNKNISTNRNEKPPESFLTANKKDGTTKKRLLAASQRFALPLMLEGKNVLCIDRTGSGKTVAMLISAIHRCGVSNLLRDYYPDYSSNNNNNLHDDDDDTDDQKFTKGNSSDKGDSDANPKPRLPESSVFFFSPTRELTRATFEIFCRIVEKLHPVVLEVENYVTRKTNDAKEENDELTNRDLYLQNLVATKKFLQKRADMSATESLRGVFAPYGAVLFGGTSMITVITQMKIMRPPMIFGTCGRTLDMVQRRGELVPTHVVCGVYFDELDELYRLGFEEQITELMKNFVISAEERRVELQICASTTVLQPRIDGSDKEEPFKKLIENFVVPNFFASENRDGAPMYCVDTMNSSYYDSRSQNASSRDDNGDEAFYLEQEETLLKNFVITTSKNDFDNKIDQLLKLILKLRFNVPTDVDVNWPCFVFVKNDKMLQMIKNWLRDNKMEKNDDETLCSIIRDYFYFVPSKFDINQICSAPNARTVQNLNPSLRFDNTRSSIPTDVRFRRVLFCAVDGSSNDDDDDHDTGSRKTTTTSSSSSSSSGIVMPSFSENFHGSIIINFDVFSTLVAVKKVQQEKNHADHFFARPNSVLPSVLYQDELSKLIQQEAVICPDYQYFIGDRKFSSTQYKKEELLTRTLMHNPKLNHTLFPLLARFQRDNNDNLEIDDKGFHHHHHHHPLLIADQYLRRIPNVSLWQFRNQKLVYTTERPNLRRGEPVPTQQSGALHQVYNFVEDERDEFALLAVESVYKIRFHEYSI